MAASSSSSSPPLQPAELATAIPLSSFWDFFTCPICLCDISCSTLLSSCGHGFCRACICECLNRKKACPLCAVEATVKDMVANPGMDQMIATIKEAQRAQAAKITKKLLPKIGAPGGASSSIDQHGDALPPPSASAGMARVDSALMPLSPVEKLFRAHATAKVLLPTEHAYQELVAEAEKAHAQNAAAAAAASSDVHMGDDAAPSFYARAVPRLIESYEQYLQTLPSPAFLEPLSVTVTLQASAVPFGLAPPAAAAPANSLQFRFNVHLWDDLTRLVEKLVAESRRPDHPSAHALRQVDLEGPRGVQVFLTATSAPLAAVLPLLLNAAPADLTRPLSSFGLVGGHCTLLVRGPVQFVEQASQPAAQCFMQSYRSDAVDQRIDYFKCTQCALNWICATCAAHCHAGHALQPFMLNHKPTYAACYCKKKGCTLQQQVAK